VVRVHGPLTISKTSHPQAFRPRDTPPQQKKSQRSGDQVQKCDKIVTCIASRLLLVTGGRKEDMSEGERSP
jgi:hypothetical protein